MTTIAAIERYKYTCLFTCISNDPLRNVKLDQVDPKWIWRTKHKTHKECTQAKLMSFIDQIHIVLICTG